MTSRRASLLLCSVAVHVLVLALLILVSAVAPGLLPAPVRHIFVDLDAARFVRTVDIPLAPRTPAPNVSPAHAAVVRTADSSPDAPPLVAPDHVSDETGREGGSSRSVGDVDVADLSDGVVDGIGQIAVESAPAHVPDRKDPIRLHSGITAPRKLTDVAPAYPDLARVARVEGIVILEVTIDANGHVAAAHVLRSVPLLDQAALDAVRRWAFTPARLNNEPVPVVMTVTVRFVLDQ